MTDSSHWRGGAQGTVTALMDRRLSADADGPYLDVCGTALTATQVDSAAGRLATGLGELGLAAGDRVATLLESSVEAVLAWFATLRGGWIAVPVNTAYHGSYLRHQLDDSGCRVLVVQHDLLLRAASVIEGTSSLEHVIVVGGGDLREVRGASVHRWEDLLAAGEPSRPAAVRPADLATFVYTGGTTGPSKGCMLSHNYHVELARQIGTVWERGADDVVWTPLPLYHFNALATVVVGTLLFGGRGAIHGRFSVSRFWPEMNRVGATITSTLGSMAYLLAHDGDRPEMPRSGASAANTSLRLLAAVPMPAEVDRLIRERFGVRTFSGAYGVTEASLVSWLPPGLSNREGAAGVTNEAYFDVRIFDERDEEQPPGTAGEIVVRPRRPHVMFEGYWGRPDATVEASRNLWYHTGDIGRVDDGGFLYFVDRKADYLRRRGENVSSYEVESVLLRHGGLADVAVHAVPSSLTEDDLKVTATVKAGSSVSEVDLFRWCIRELPYFVLPRFIELRDELPRSPVGRVLKRQLREEGVTPSTWDAEASGIDFDRR